MAITNDSNRSETVAKLAEQIAARAYEIFGDGYKGHRCVIASTDDAEEIERELNAAFEVIEVIQGKRSDGERFIFSVELASSEELFYLAEVYECLNATLPDGALAKVVINGSGETSSTILVKFDIKHACYQVKTGHLAFTLHLGQEELENDIVVKSLKEEQGGENGTDV